jgi:hypothetical protein
MCLISTDDDRGGGTKAVVPPTTTLTSSDRLRVWGDIGHVATLISTVVFAASVVTWVDQVIEKEDDAVVVGETGSISNNSSSTFPLFDTQWQRQGFCITHPETPEWSSHAVCLYVDVLFAIVLALIYWPHRNRSVLRHANLLVSTNVLGTIGHGLAHGGLAYHMYVQQQQLQQQQTGIANNEDVAAAVPTDETATLLNWFVFPILFWLPLMKAAMSNAPNYVVTILALLANGLVATVPDHLGFTVVQTILLVAFSLNQLLRPTDEKQDLHYVLYSWMVSFPLTLVGWMESTMCSLFVRSVLYGHVVYDAYIPVSALAFYLMCIRNANYHQQEEEKKKKTL